ncbi:MAG: LacI family DNA-binding transcriptional regulator [Gorillibacterium sp.]|nr:LacI family DNA-binding transcriptional regulator [Gorillibacterium sp.]
MRGKVTIQQIADLVGVSKFAVSRALAGKSGVSLRTKEMILKAAGQLGYFKEQSNTPTPELYDFESQSLSGTILVLFPNIRYQNRESLYWGPVFDGISARLNQKGLDILTLTEPSGDRIFTLLNPKAIVGIVSVGTISSSILLEIKRLDIPVVMVDHLDPVVHCDTVFTDNVSCMKELVTKLISRGNKSFQFVGNIKDAQSYYERWFGFRSALDEFGLEHKQIPSLITDAIDSIEVTLPDAIQKHGLPEVLVCANDSIAEYAISVLKDHGYDIPGRCAVTGFDNTNDKLPILATVNVNKGLLGMRAVDQLLRRILNRSGSYEKLLLHGDVIIREYNAATKDTVNNVNV